MKKQLLFLAMILLPLVASADPVEVNGIYFSLSSKDNTAEVNSVQYRDVRTTINIPQTIIYQDVVYSVTSICVGACKNCTKVTSISIPNSVTSIGNGAFSYCSKLTSVIIPNSVNNIGINPFSGCTELANIIVDTDNTKYDSRENCNAIIETATNTLIAGCKNTIVPNSVSSIGSHAFYDCTTLISITIPNSVNSIGVGAFSFCRGLTSVSTGNGLTSIGDFAFGNCYALTYMTIGNNVTSIGEGAFQNCVGLTYFIIPQNVANIDDCTFYNCTKLAYITIPSSVTSIGNSVFESCTALTNVFCCAKTVPNTPKDTFKDSKIKSAILHVPSSSIDAYKASYPWKYFKEIVALKEGDPGYTGITNIKQDKTDSQYYDLKGNKLEKPTKGINIINGKKVIVK